MPLSRRGRWLVVGAAFGAFWLAAVPVGLLFLVSQAVEGDLTVVSLAAGVVGSIFAATAALIAYLVLKT